MSSYTIPEEVIGVPLFVPDSYDQFEVETGGMPNGDDCLIVHGNVSTNYMAYQNAQVTTPDMFRNPNLSGNPQRSCSVWLKLPSMASTGALFASHSLGATTSSGAFSCNAAATADVTFVQGTSGGSPGFTFSRRIYTQTGIRNNAWRLLVINISNQSSSPPVNSGIYLDLNTADGSDSAGNGTGTNTPNSNHKFVIGSYSSSMVQFAGEWRIGKLAFHSKYLNETERAILYKTMMEP